MLTSRPFEKIFDGTFVSEETVRRFVDSVTHYHLESGLVVSVMDRSTMLSIDGLWFEVMVFDESTKRSWGPVHFETERECLKLRDRLVEGEDPVDVFLGLEES